MKIEEWRFAVSSDDRVVVMSYDDIHPINKIGTRE